MLNNLFSSFDMKNFFMYSYLMLNFYYFMILSIKSKLNNLLILMKKMFFLLINNVIKEYIFIMIFFLIFFLNLFSLNMFMFNMTSQFNFNLSMIMILWLPVLLMSLTKKNNNFLIHILPYGTSKFLIPMMILIELLSFFIRPLTLFLRLSINMIAGHVLMSLISNMILNKNLMYLLIMYIYMLMKFLVSFIQSYIIITLLNLYIEEIYVKYKLFFIKY